MNPGESVIKKTMAKPSRPQVDAFSLVCSVLSGLVLLFVVGPLVGLFVQSSPSELLETARDTEVQRSIWLTLWTSMGITLIWGVAAIPLAYVLARKRFPLKGVVSAAIDLPIVLPHPAAGIALLGVISRETTVGKLADRLGISFISQPAGIMLAMAFVSIPFLVNEVRDGFHGVPERLEKAALALGSSPTRVFTTISVPLAWRSILSGIILMWARGMSEFGAVVVIAYHPPIAPILIYERLTAYGLAHARSATVLVICLCLVLFAAIRLVARERDRAAS